MSPQEQEVRSWLSKVVIGLNLCPFAKQPLQRNAVQFVVSFARNDEEVLADLQRELVSLDQANPTKHETTLLIIADHLQDFYDYNDFLNAVDSLLRIKHWVGRFQVASFHPQYCFAGVEPEAQENLTNRSPFPILHILREDSLARAIDNYPDVEKIPQRNIERMDKLTAADIETLFSYLNNAG